MSAATPGLCLSAALASDQGNARLSIGCVELGRRDAFGELYNPIHATVHFLGCSDTSPLLSIARQSGWIHQQQRFRIGRLIRVFTATEG